MAHAEEFSDHRLYFTRIFALLHLRSTEQQTTDEVKLDCRTCRSVESEPLSKASREKPIDDSRIAIGDNVFPGNKNIIKYNAQIRLVKAAREGIIKRRTYFLGQVFV